MHYSASNLFNQRINFTKTCNDKLKLKYDSLIKFTRYTIKTQDWLQDKDTFSFF